MKAQKPPPYDADTVADLEQVAKRHLDSRNEIKALKKVVRIYHELCEELSQWIDSHMPLEGSSSSYEEGFHLICEADYRHRTGSPDSDGDQAGSAEDVTLDDKTDMEGRLEMLERLKRVDGEVRESLVVAGIEIP
ncbi:hypothetical protein MMC17_002395 [Xylographa soralifera]|nr:hypothetical protein [Xylographa soralifera]